jgi:AcrR family transcriptional regulator
MAHITTKGKRQTSELKLIDRKQWIKRDVITELCQQIISAATEEFAAKGILGTTVADITRRAGTSDPTFYRYFASIRDAALFIMSEYYWAPLNLRLRHYRVITSEPLQLFEAILEVMIQSNADEPNRPWLAESKVFQLLVCEAQNPLLMPELTLESERVEFLAQLAEIIAAGQQQQIFTSNIRAELLAQSIVQLLHSLLKSNNLSYQNNVVGKDELKQLVRQLVGQK